jgi:hypothetical protein
VLSAAVLRYGIMHIRAEQIRQWFASAKWCRGQYELWMQKADAETDPGCRKALEQVAALDMTVANSMQNNAERLLRQFEQDGGVYDYNQR